MQERSIAAPDNAQPRYVVPALHHWYPTMLHTKYRVGNSYTIRKTNTSNSRYYMITSRFCSFELWHTSACIIAIEGADLTPLPTEVQSASAPRLMQWISARTSLSICSTNNESLSTTRSTFYLPESLCMKHLIVLTLLIIAFVTAFNLLLV
jgi:hypothetical protein